MWIERVILKVQEAQVEVSEAGLDECAESMSDVLGVLEACKNFAQIEQETAKNPRTKSVFKFEKAQSALLNLFVAGDDA
jgi:hypothetical protein